MTLLFLLSNQKIFASVSLGAILEVSNVKVDTIYAGAGPIYVKFDTSSMTGCNVASSGYLKPLWESAVKSENPNAEISEEAGNRMLSVLLSAKATNTPVKVYYQVNSKGTGWNKCAIYGVFY